MYIFDRFKKPEQEFQVKTLAGGYLSVASVTIIVVLFLSELRYFLEVEKQDELMIDLNQDVSAPIQTSLKLTLHDMPCSMTYLNMFDGHYANLLNITHRIFKARLDAQGNAIDAPRIRDGFRDVAETSNMLMMTVRTELHEARTAKATARSRCGSCYDAKPPNACCQTCEDVHAAWRERGWAIPQDWVPEQCEEDAYESQPPQPHEGCALDIQIDGRKSPSSIMISVGYFYKHSLVHKDFQKQAETGRFDFRHTIESLQFGPTFPTLKDVLAGRTQSFAGPNPTAYYQYDLSLIPTVYIPLHASPIHGNQYSVTEYVRPASQKTHENTSSSVGVHISLAITPFTVQVTEWQRSWTHFLTEVCAILGGIFSFTGMLDTFFYRMSCKSKDLKFGEGLRTL